MSSTLNSLLTESAVIYPNNIAVSYRDEQLSYRELNDLSSQLALCCIQAGISRGDRIGIYIDKSIEAVISIFGILKSGACYVPLDPISPVERQVLIINDCLLEYVITSSKKLSQIRRIAQNTKSLKYVFVLDITKDEFTENMQGIQFYFKDDIFKFKTQNNMLDNHRNTVTENNLAYILYTSGSTGQPKGVMLSHKAAIAFVNWTWKTFNITSDDIVSSHAPFHFDLSIFDIFASIKAGATICLVPHGLSSFPKSVVDFMEKKKISTWYSVPSILIQLVLHGGLEEKKLPALRQILFAGEVFPTKYLRMLMKLVPRVKFYNLYGPTETNVIAYHYVKELSDDTTSIPIGMLCDGVKPFIVNEENTLVKDGEIGELYVAAPTLMDGYWNDLKKTESVLFKKPPFACLINEAIYKTGDRVNFNREGLLEYHGRCDSMIKSRGYRIEIGEIEAALSSHPDVKEVAVVGIMDDKIGKKLKAVIVPQKEGIFSEEEVKHFCSQKLPHYMIPELIFFVNELPRTSTGKIDRKKLEKEDI